MVAVLAAVLIWWAATGLILVLNNQPPRTFRVSMAVATCLLGVALYGIFDLRNDSSLMGVYLGFGCGLLAWGWLEMSFLMGYITGPRKHGCTAGCSGWRHFIHAVQAILYHEITIIVLVLTAFALSAGGSNRIAAETLLLLWGMRTSAKLNLFLGVRNLSAELLPEKLTYLASYFRRRPLNWLFPISVTAGTALVAMLGFHSPSHALLATLAALGVLEHWMLVLPMSTTALWSWFRDPSAPDSPPACSPR